MNFEPFYSISSFNGETAEMWENRKKKRPINHELQVGDIDIVQVPTSNATKSICSMGIESTRVSQFLNSISGTSPFVVAG